MKRTPLKRTRSVLRRDFDAEAAKAWLGSMGWRCAVCGERQRRERLEGHHVIPQRLIRAHVRSLAHTLKLPDAEAVVLLRRLLWDPRNGVPVHRECHARLERRFATIVPSDEAWDFARELGLEWWLEKHYAKEAA